MVLGWVTPCCTRFCAPSGQNLSRRPPRRWFWASEFAVTATQSVSWGSERAFRNGAAIAIPSSFEKVPMVSARACRVRYAVGLVGIGEIRRWRFRDRSRGFGARNGLRSSICAVRDVHKGEGRRTQNECDHTSTKAPDPIRTPKLSVLGRE